MRNLFLYPPVPVRTVLDKTTLYRAARYFTFSRQVTPEWSDLSTRFKAKHFVAVYKFISSKGKL